jgi:hypothetical protein
MPYAHGIMSFRLAGVYRSDPDSRVSLRLIYLSVRVLVRRQFGLAGSASPRLPKSHRHRKVARLRKSRSPQDFTVEPPSNLRTLFRLLWLFCLFLQSHQVTDQDAQPDGNED